MTFRYKHSYALTFLQSLVFFLFLYSGITKTIGFGLFVNALDKSLFFNDFNTRFIGIFVIAAEFAIPVLLFFESTALYGYLLSFLNSSVKIRGTLDEKWRKYFNYVLLWQSKSHT